MELTRAAHNLDAETPSFPASGIVPCWASADGRVVLYHNDCLEVLPLLDQVDAIITDPPYMGVVKEEWDNQWKTDADFLLFVDSLLVEFHARLAANGSLYFFTSPQMAGRVEVAIRNKFNVLNNIVWDKGATRKGVAGTGIDVTALRRFWSSSTERLIFAEKYGADTAYQDALIGENETYWKACQIAKSSIIGDYLREEFAKAGVTNRDIAALFPSKTGGLTGCVSNWMNGANFPIAEQYETIKVYLNRNGGDFLRREYEDLRRPFYLQPHLQWGEVWNFAPLNTHKRHPCEKPTSLMAHILNISSKKGAVVLDPFAGTGTTGVACVRTGRRFIGIEKDAKYFEIAKERIKQELRQGRLF
mgnify:FL=1